MSIKHGTFLSALLLTLGLAGQTQAGVITIGGSGSAVASPARSVDFSSAPLGASTSFSGSGLTFSTIGGGGFAIYDADVAGCSQGPTAGVSGRFAYFGIQAQEVCGLSTLQDAAKIVFSDVVSELSWTGFSRGIGDSSIVVEALLNGSLVSSLVLDQGNRFEGQVVSITGGHFNELRFAEAAGKDVYFGIDNMAWNVAGPSIPEPGALALVALGLVGLGWSRRHRSS